MNTQALINTLSDSGFTVDLREGGTELVIPCPLCWDENPRLYIEAATGVWTCFKCGAKGHLRNLLVDVCELSFGEAVIVERAIVGYEEAHVPMHVSRPPPASTVELPSGFIPLDYSLSAYGTSAVQYLQSRGVSLRTAVELGVGFCLTGRYAQRIIIPVYTQHKLRTFVARSWVETEQKKVLMPKGSQAERALFGYDLLVTDRAHWTNLILVEGIFDALHMWQCGYRETVATLGAHVTELQRSLVKRLNPDTVVLLRDADDAGREAAIKEAREFATNMLSVSIATLPSGDPGSASQQDIHQALDNARPVTLDFGIESQKEVHR